MTKNKTLWPKIKQAFGSAEALVEPETALQVVTEHLRKAAWCCNKPNHKSLALLNLRIILKLV